MRECVRVCVRAYMRACVMCLPYTIIVSDIFMDHDYLSSSVYNPWSLAHGSNCSVSTLHVSSHLASVVEHTCQETKSTVAQASPNLHRDNFRSTSFLFFIIYTIICLKSVCLSVWRRSQTAGRNSCSIASGDVSK